MSTKYIASNWRLLNQENSSKSDNYGLTFDGTELIDCGADTNLDLNNSFSISTWIKFTSTSSMVVLSKREATKISLLIELGSGKPFTAIRDASSNIAITNTYSGTYNDGNWHHIVATFDRTANELKLYVDNELKETANTSSVGDIAPTTNNLMIGRRSDTSSSFFTGSISECAVFDYALSSTQISTLYGSSSLGAGNPMALPTPVAYYPLGDNSASNPLTQPNEAVEDASVFDFSSDYIDLGDTSLNVNNLSVSVWFKTTSTTSGQQLISKYSTTSSNRQFQFRLETNGTVTIFPMLSDGNIATVQSSTSGFNDGNWHNALWTFNTTDGHKLYIDGTQLGTDSTTTTLETSTNPMLIGARWLSTGVDTARYFDGEISNIAIWNSDQSSEISNIYNSGVPATSYTNTPTAWYKLDQSANWEADSAGDWQIPDAVSAYPESFDFNGLRGADGYPKQEIIAPNVPQGQNFTFSCWANFNNPTANLYHPLIVVYSGSTSVIELVKTRNTGSEANQVYFTVRNTSNNRVLVYSNVVPTANEWCHIAGTYDGSNVTIYFNGAAGQSLSQTGDTIASAPIEIGSWYYWNTTYGANFDGQISNVQYFDTALPATGSNSIETLYNNGTPLTTAIASDNLKGWYKLNDNEKFDGTNWSVENQKYPAGFDSALSFPASDDYISIGSTTLGINTAIAISAWVKTSVNTGYGAIIGEDNAGPKRNWNLLRKADDIFFTIYHDATGTNKTNITTSTVNISDDKWHHIVGTWDGTTNADSMKVYFDGVEVGQATPSSTGINTEAAEPWIGNSTDNPSGYNNWTGELSNIAIYNTNLDSSAVQALYNNGTPETSISSSPVSWWKLNNLTTGIQDSVGSNDGTNNGATKVNTFVSTEAATSSGMTEQNLVNNNVSVLNGESSGMTSANLVLSDLTRAVPYDSYSFNFDSASSDYIDTSSLNSTIQTQTSGAISLWIYPTVISGTKYFIGYSNSSTTVDFFQIGTFTSGKLRLLFRNDASGTAWPTNGVDLRSNASVISTNNWYHICVVSDGSAYTVYLNGSAITMNVDAGSNSGKWFGDFSGVTMDNLYIGASSNSGGVNLPFDGKISNLSIFNEALTSTEVLKLYANGVPQDLSTFTPQPVAWYTLGSNSFWNGSNWICRDLIGSNDGTSANAGADAIVGDAPRSEANGTGTNMDIESNITGTTKWSELNSWSINMSSTARVEDTP